MPEHVHQLQMQLSIIRTVKLAFENDEIVSFDDSNAIDVCFTVLTALLEQILCPKGSLAEKQCSLMRSVLLFGLCKLERNDGRELYTNIIEGLEVLEKLLKAGI